MDILFYGVLICELFVVLLDKIVFFNKFFVINMICFLVLLIVFLDFVLFFFWDKMDIMFLYVFKVWSWSESCLFWFNVCFL